MACVIVPGEAWSWYGDKANHLRNTYHTLCFGVQHTDGHCRRNHRSLDIHKRSFWMMSGALAGIISVASGLDIYFPGLAFIIAFVAGVICNPVRHGWNDVE